MKRLRVALLADYLEKDGRSMDLIAEMLLDRLSREHAATMEATLIRPLLPQAAVASVNSEAGLWG